MRNDIAKILGPVLILADNVISGFRNAGAHLNFTHVTQAVIEADLKALTEARQEYQEAKAELQALRADLKVAAVEAKAFATIARDISKRHHGNQWSSAWESTPHERSLVILINPTFLEGLTLGRHGYLKSNPTRESADMQVTAARAEAVHKRVREARNRVIQQKVQVNLLLAVRNEKFQILRKHLRQVIDELGLLIEPTDVIWKGFGLNQPGLEATPAVPQEVAVMSQTETKVAVKWKRPARARTYHVWQRAAGTEEPFVRVETVRDTDCWLEPGEKAVEIAISAVNNGGESGLSKGLVIALSTAKSPPLVT